MIRRIKMTEEYSTMVIYAKAGKDKWARKILLDNDIIKQMHNNDITPIYRLSQKDPLVKIVVDGMLIEITLQRYVMNTVKGDITKRVSGQPRIDYRRRCFIIQPALKHCKHCGSVIKEK
jgi:hypothetical protein